MKGGKIWENFRNDTKCWGNYRKITENYRKYAKNADRIIEELVDIYVGKEKKKKKISG